MELLLKVFIWNSTIRLGMRREYYLFDFVSNIILQRINDPILVTAFYFTDSLQFLCPMVVRLARNGNHYTSFLAYLTLL